MIIFIIKTLKILNNTAVKYKHIQEEYTKIKNEKRKIKKYPTKTTINYR